MSPDLAAWLESLRVPQRPDEWEVKAALALYGVRAPRGVRLSPDEALPRLTFGEPYVVKVCSPDILHKTEQRGVRLKIEAAALADAVADLRRRFPGQPLLVEEHLKLSGRECIVGALVDREFGPAVMVGAGGILTEIYRDVAFRLAPCEPDEAVRMIGELKIAPLFSGFRGITMDAAALAQVIAATSQLAVDLGDRFSQLDINPVGDAGDAWVALDAKLILKT
ncbi:MAG: acetate--CoA ligase family protein [Deltaproteobacteria bacterium]|nr:acetate--CoA ligase family protein [Deltaproteobacteria bacterium]